VKNTFVSAQLKAVMNSDCSINELDDNLLDIYHAAAQATETKEDMEADKRGWRQNLHFSIFRGGFTSR